MKFILGLKLGMAQIFDEQGNAIPVTLIDAGPCQVTQIKTKEKDGYNAVQFGFAQKKKGIKKTEKGKEFRWLKELRFSEDETCNVNPKEIINVSIFKEGDNISVSGISKGKGFAGVVKRWHFRGKNSTHGTKHQERTPGSVGSTHPARVVKGRRLPGKAGEDRVTVKNLTVARVDEVNKILAVRGAVPGRKGILLEIRG